MMMLMMMTAPGAFSTPSAKTPLQATSETEFEKGTGGSSPPVSRWLRGLITVWIGTNFVLAFLLTFLTQIVAWVCLRLIGADEALRFQVLGTLLRFWNVLFAFTLNPFWKVVVVKPPPAKYKPRDTIVMANHCSGADPWILSRVLFPWELKYIVKADLLKIPIAGWCLKLAGDLPVYFTKEKGGWGTKPGSVAEMMRRVKGLQSAGIGQVVFPEGTRSVSGRLQPFKDGFFRFAIENRTEILPLAITNAQALWPLGSSWFGYGTAFVAFGEPTRPLEKETVEELKTRVQKAMVELLRLCPMHDVGQEEPLKEQASMRGRGIRGN